jgi:hypothetical protein
MTKSLNSPGKIIGGNNEGLLFFAIFYPTITYPNNVFALMFFRMLFMLLISGICLEQFTLPHSQFTKNLI